MLLFGCGEILGPQGLRGPNLANGKGDGTNDGNHRPLGTFFFFNPEVSICCIEMLVHAWFHTGLGSPWKCSILRLVDVCIFLLGPQPSKKRNSERNLEPPAGWVYLHHLEGFDFLNPPPFTLRKPQRICHSPRRKMTRSPSVSTGWEAHWVELHVLTGGWKLLACKKCPDYIMRMACNM